ncbi:Aro80p NDAI_0H01580 [Naumovozyma dairenensis CBS 421]|uniref:Zn(2)-C6 fungal-type domain-containing protein n=1 Tax=Naumovozyma dairenensis (strain ATCC 10597 / BCRC 20456 / CBS 421 / NBRC 0211 / NRRL Y-12639) TaxID=1071378 RepID=G0WEX1_NAUDC|nr:hypothetical protein NDAI_0H01580 [Naumovozyma dairenensis CBS 421]CCD26332.1 hypothetical protein NDAI_0H01580 [Naumovozyma dairenensis CBS 421]
MCASLLENEVLQKRAPNYKWKRGYKACTNCKLRKVKCDMGPLENPHDPPCARCRREGKTCVFLTTKGRKADLGTSKIPSTTPTLKPNSGNSVSKKRLDSSTDLVNEVPVKIPKTSPSNPISPTKWKIGLTSMQNSLEFLAKAAGNVGFLSAPSAHSAREELNSAVVPKATSLPQEESLMNMTSSLHSDLLNISPIGKLQHKSLPLIDKLNIVRPTPRRKLTDIDYIGPNRLLSESDAIELIDLFFLTMFPFFPNIPLQLQNPKELAQYPILLCAILTISSRYHSFDTFADSINNGQNNKRRHIDVHEKLWIYCQRLISQTIWAEASTRSIGTILAFIIFTEWNPRAIHWNWSDYASDPALNDISKRNMEPQIIKREEEGLTGIDAIRRSDRMAWMLSGTAVRLAQDTGLIRTNTKVAIATHISDTHTAMNMNQRSALSHSFNSDFFDHLSKSRYIGKDSTQVVNENFYLTQILQNKESKERWKKISATFQKDNEETVGQLSDMEYEFLNDEYALYFSKEDNDSSQRPPLPLKFTFVQRAKLELLRIVTLGYETIYYENGEQRLVSDDQRRNLAVLNILSPLIDSWYSNYNSLLKTDAVRPVSPGMHKRKQEAFKMSQNISGETMISDYYYCQLYIFSLALQVDVGQNKLKLNEITRCAIYVEKAYVAAKEILESAGRVHKLKMLKYMPVKWVMRIVRSVAFIVKCYLTLTSGSFSSNPEARTILSLSAISVDETIQTIQDTAIILKEAAPDELHLSTRYSAILLYLCREMKSKHESSQQSKGYDSKSSSNAPLSDDVITNQSGDKMSEDILLKSHAEVAAKDPRTSQENIELQMNKPNLDGKFASDMDFTTDNLNELPGDVANWFTTSGNIGLEFVEPWTEMIEQMYLQSGDANTTFDDLYKEICQDSK